MILMGKIWRPSEADHFTKQRRLIMSPDDQAELSLILELRLYDLFSPEYKSDLPNRLARIENTLMLVNKLRLPNKESSSAEWVYGHFSTYLKELKETSAVKDTGLRYDSPEKMLNPLLEIIAERQNDGLNDEGEMEDFKYSWKYGEGKKSFDDAPETLKFETHFLEYDMDNNLKEEIRILYKPGRIFCSGCKKTHRLLNRKKSFLFFFEDKRGECNEAF
jgi:hypothetical protein